MDAIVFVLLWTGLALAAGAILLLGLAVVTAVLARAGWRAVQARLARRPDPVDRHFAGWGPEVTRCNAYDSTAGKGVQP